ncbi:MAG: phosphate ABC transporter permease subunit PstC [Rectinema sp.]|nr:phosphate ABC transporter permease subunit PstC [Rectinema sp.]
MNDRIFRRMLAVGAVLIIATFVGVIITLGQQAWPLFQSEGGGFLTGTEWNPVTSRFGALPFMLGTVLTSLLALMLAIPFSLGTGILLGEYISHPSLRTFLNTMVNVIASIPSVVFGLWGIDVIVPRVRALALRVGAPPYGSGILSASLVLAIMIIPYMTSMTREALRNVPSALREGAYALGLTKYEVITGVSVPGAWQGISAGILLSLGRALGETMAVTMLIGNATRIPTSLFSLGNTIASVIASQFNEAASDLHRAAMMALALLLLVITMAAGWVGRTLMRKDTMAYGR